MALLGAEADEVVCHTIPRELFGVGRWYRDFSPVSDEEVLALLAAPCASRAGGPPAGPPARPSRELMLDVGGVRAARRPDAARRGRAAW